MLGLNLNPLPGQEFSLPLSYNIAAAVKWGQFLYTGILGSSKIYLIRGLGVKEITLETGMDQSFSSHALDNDDIVMLNSSSQSESLSAANLLSRLGTLTGTDEKLSLIIKNTIPVEAHETSKNSKKTSGLLHRLKSKLKKPTKEKTLGLAVIVLGLFLTTSVVLSFGQKKSESKNVVLGDATTNVVNLVKTAQNDLAVESDKSKESLAAAQAAWDGLPEESKLTSQAKTLKETLTSLNLAAYDIRSLTSFREASMPAEVYYARQNAAKVPVTSSRVTSFAPYLNYLYLVVPGEPQIYKATPSGSTYTISKWLSPQASVGEGLGVTVDGEVWVLTSNNILRFYRGAQKEFALSGIDRSFNNPVAIYTNGDLNNLYVYDSGNGRVVAFSKSGRYVFQIILPSLPFSVRDLVVDELKKTFTLVGDTKAISGNF